MRNEKRYWYRNRQSDEIISTERENSVDKDAFPFAIIEGYKADKSIWQGKLMALAAHEHHAKTIVDALNNTP